MASGEIFVPILSYEDIRSKADDFLAEFHPSREIPVPIEEIIEFQLDMNIVPLPGLKDLLDIDGFISGDLSIITVDEYIFNKFENRYRFTLAHEVGHFWLHHEFYESAGLTGLDEWKEFVTEIPEDKHNWLEYQAYSFAGLVLVPQEPLIEEVNSKIKLLDGSGISLMEHWDLAWEYICSDIAKSFSVSKAVIEKRVTKDEIRGRYRGC